MIEITRKDFDEQPDLGKSAHPDQVMSGLIEKITTIGAEKFLRGAGLNKERDSFIAVLFA